MLKIKSVNTGPEYNENYQFALRMALLDGQTFGAGTLRAYHRWATCKDFFSDIFWSEQTRNEVFDQYGLSWKPGTLPEADRYFLGLDGNKIARYSETMDLHPLAATVEKHINVWDDQLGIPRTVIHKAEKGRLVAEFSKHWVYKPTMTSLFTLLLRCGFKYDKFVGKGEPLEYLRWLEMEGNQPFGPGDGTYLNELRTAKNNRLGSVWGKKRCAVGRVPAGYIDVNYVHNYSGILNEKDVFEEN